MKLLIASDLHGSAFYTEKLLERYAKEGAERLILLGDILYHGPRNDLPERYAPKEVLAMLNPHAAEILCVRGNCDCEVDQMVLDFPVLADYGFLLLEGRAAYLTHGHVINKAHPLPFQKGDILLHGHTHIPKCAVRDTYICMNPGSVAIPKAGSHHGYMTLEDGVFTWKDLSGTAYHTLAL